MKQYTQQAVLYEMTEAERSSLQRCLLGMLVDVIAVCKKNNICYMLGGGSCLGAVRHQGFIPWDDDLDLMMPREDYNCFIACFEEELSGQYELNAPNSVYAVSNNFMKILKKGTIMEDIFNLNAPVSHSVYLDIFPMDYAPRNPVARWCKGAISDIWAVMGVSRYLYEHRNGIIKQYYKERPKENLLYQIRLALGWLAGFWSYKQWYNCFDRFVQGGRKTKYMTIPTGRNHYWGECLPIQVFYPPTEGTFEGITVNLPKDTSRYLTHLYGDYMKIPPTEKRERHFFITLQL